MIQVISGGQTGADRIGLEVARSMHIKTGGMAPKGWRTETGPDPSLADFGLIESNSSLYGPRTVHNLKNSDGTVLFGDMTSPGSLETVRGCIASGKPYVTNPLAEELADWIKANGIKVLNVAGNRGSKLDSVKQSDIRTTLREAFTLLGFTKKDSL
jgi:hypothetical protein